MELVDIYSLEKWEEFVDEIRERSGLNAAVFNTEGIRLHNHSIWPNHLCPEVKAIPKGQSFICATAHMNIAGMAEKTHEPVIEECDAGLVKVLVPIFVDDTFLGTIGGCGHLLDCGEVDSFLVNKIVGIEEDRVEKLSEGVPSISTQQAHELIELIQQKVDQIVSDYQNR